MIVPNATITLSAPHARQPMFALHSKLRPLRRTSFLQMVASSNARTTSSLLRPAAELVLAARATRTQHPVRTQTRRPPALTLITLMVTIALGAWLVVPLALQAASALP